MNRREFIRRSAAGLAGCAAAAVAPASANAKQVSGGMPRSCGASLLPEDPTPEEIADLKRKWSYWMDPPEGYRFTPEVKFVKKVELDDGCVAELYLQRNGPKPHHVQRVLKMFPKDAKEPLPAIVCPDYYVEGSAGFKFEDPQKPFVASEGVTMSRHLARKGFATITCDAFHLNYVTNEIGKESMNRWKVAAHELYKDWPEWNCMAKKVHDIRLTIDLLESDSRIDMTRVGMAGHSLGGQTTLYAGCLDPRVKAMFCDDFGFRFDQNNWDMVHYWGGRLSAAQKADGLENHQLLTLSGAKPFCLVAGHYDDDTSFTDMLKAKGYRSRPGDLMFINHATGHQPPEWALEAGYDFLYRKLNGIWGEKPWS